MPVGGSGGQSGKPSSLVPLAVGCGCTVGPGPLDGRPAGGWFEGALVRVEVGGTRCGYWRRAAPAAVLAAFEDEEPMLGIYLDVGLVRLWF